MTSITAFSYILAKTIKMTSRQLQDRIANSPTLDFGDIFSRAFDLFQKVWVQGLILQLLRLVVNYGLAFVMYIPMLGSGFIFSSTIENGNTGELGIGMIIWLVFIGLLYLAFILAMAIATTGLEMAFYRIVRLKERGVRQSDVNFGMFFKRQYLKKTVLFAMAQMGIALLAVMLCIAPIFYVIVPLQLAVIIFAFNPELSINEVYNLAFKLGNKKWLIAFGLLFVSGLLALITGAIACLIGIYLTISFVYLPVYLIYSDTIGFTEDDEAIASIGEGLSKSS